MPQSTPSEASGDDDNAVTSAFPKLKGSVKLFSTPNPDGHPEFIAAIEGATSSIKLEMFHLTDPAVVAALIDAADTNGVAVQVILDGDSLQQSKYKKIAAQLTTGHPNVEVRGSSPAFSITHEKAMVIDDETAFVTSINLTKEFATTRDFGVITTDASIIDEMNAVFAADWQNAADGTGDTPELSQPNLVYSPIDSEDRIVELIASATKTIDATVENLGDKRIDDALAAAAQNGVAVRFIAPMCDQNPNPLYNYKYLTLLSGAGVDSRVMPYPGTATTPYMHSKMILADHKTVYIGSVNFSTNSATKARELGIIVPLSSTLAKKVESAFEDDWSASVAPPSPLPKGCPVIE